MLYQNVARVQAVVHPVHRQPELGLAADQRPQDGGKSGELRQQRIVQVQGAVRREVVQLRRHPGVPAIDDDDIGFGALDQVDGLGVNPLGEVHRDAVVVRELLDRRRKDRLVGLLAGRMGDREHDVVIQIDQGLQGPVSPGLEAERHDAHHANPSNSHRRPGAMPLLRDRSQAQQIMLAFAKLHGSGGCRGDGGPDRSFCCVWLLPDECGPFGATRSRGSSACRATLGWIRQFHEPDLPESLPLLVFPHAGAGASAYREFSKALSKKFKVIVFQYPGRQDRAAEALLGSLPEIAAGAFGEFSASDHNRGVPIVTFGHSMGAMVAFEFVRIAEASGIDVRQLNVSATVAPCHTAAQTTTSQG